MKALPFLLPALTLSLAAQEVQVLKAPITKVRLHPDEAWVTRVGRVRVEEAGLQRFEIRNLPTGLRLEDIQVSAKGPTGTRLGDVNLRAEVRTVMETQEWKKLEGEKESLRDKQDALEAQRDALKQEQAFLRSLQATHAQELSSRMTYTLPQAQSLAEFGKGLQTRMASLLQQEKRAQRDLDQLKLEQARVQADMDKRRGEQRTAPTSIAVELTLSNPGPVEIDLSYRQTQARWRPTYEARLSEDRKNLSLALNAAITQNTGESWTGVKVEISNARPSRGLNISSWEAAQIVSAVPPLPPPPPPPAAENKDGRISIRGSQGLGQRLLLNGQDVADNVFTGGRRSYSIDESIEVVDGDAPITEEASGLAATWSLEGAKDIPSDGEPHRFRVQSRELQPKIALFAAPRLTNDVQQIARFDAPSNFPLFPRAAVTHYVGGQRLGQSQLTMPTVGQSFTLGFGPYKPMRASLRKVDHKEETVGTFTKEHQWSLKDQMEIANDGAEAMDVEVQDRMLKSEQDTIKVTPQPETTPGFQEKIPGVRTWTLSVPAKGKSSVTVATQVRSPINMPLQGLD
jgi:hypothetical protein